VLALPLADVVVRDADPVVLLRVGDHSLDQEAVRFLDVGAASDLSLRLAHPDHESVANPLELSRAEYPRAAGGANAPIDAVAREGRGPELAEPALEPSDLTPEVIPDEALVLDRGAGPLYARPAISELEVVLCE
jgi:hypothetical protein